MKENKTKVISFRVSQNDYELLEVFSTFFEIKISDFLQKFIKSLVNLNFEKQEVIMNWITNKLSVR